MTKDKRPNNKYFGVLAKRAQERRDQQKQLNKDYKRIAIQRQSITKISKANGERQGKEVTKRDPTG